MSMLDYDKKGELLVRYKQLLISLEEESSGMASSVDTTQSTDGILLNISSYICNTDSRSLYIRRRFRISVDMRKVYCFFGFLYFDIKSQELSDKFEVTRQVIHFYCTQMIGRYSIDKDFREKIHDVVNPEVVQEMIEKFAKIKRNAKEGQIKEMC
jgi:hypothetical protein